eukprot:TRINITY_DN33867_c0_g1_i1.p1 TRINITY_DN33867_c0_g1~~TRINITY_DN33867_c0_g1_i1.p1  ORF type:complete len:572 (+),score=113.88 TRINITY_DN33867_c0_g1_i1:127-1842(+)
MPMDDIPTASGIYTACTILSSIVMGGVKSSSIFPSPALALPETGHEFDEDDAEGRYGTVHSDDRMLAEPGRSVLDSCWLESLLLVAAVGVILVMALLLRKSRRCCCKRAAAAASGVRGGAEASRLIATATAPVGPPGVDLESCVEDGCLAVVATSRKTFCEAGVQTDEMLKETEARGVEPPAPEVKLATVTTHIAAGIQTDAEPIPFARRAVEESRRSASDSEPAWGSRRHEDSASLSPSPDVCLRSFATSDNDWEDATSLVANLEQYVTHLCAPEIDAATAEALASEGDCLWKACSACEASETIAAVGPERAASAIVWALMRQALQRRQGFQQGTFLVRGATSENVYFALLPHTYDRAASHFRENILPFEISELARVRSDPVTAVASEDRVGATHVGIDLPHGCSYGLPAWKQTVLLGRVREHDGSVAVYVKPEDHGCDLTSLSPENVGHILRHGADFVVSQYNRRLGDRRAHDEGEFKRKEHVPVLDRKRFQELLDALHSELEGPMMSGPRKTLGEMARNLRQIEAALSVWRKRAVDLLQRWEAAHGPDLDFKHGREVLINISELGSAD